MSKIIVTVLLLSAYLFGSDAGAEGSTDIVQRTINFLIFAGILFYILAEPVKSYFSGRSTGIADELEKVQERLRESKRLKEAAEHKIEEAEHFANELSESSKKENKILSDKILAQSEQDLEIITKQNVALMELEKRKMVREVVSEVMNDVMNSSNDALGKEAMTEILKKKVA
ncbi:F0F1 ATP synthase subunit B [Sulfuricurvum sp. RIFCSPLOWO2_12_FULL_43_24]|uniref:F0F1 ATP synthase subunit B n=1 Tax=Sulfuricurvum sp. RIFCSPLOWO2_12_FULL_43_24 TaxID=1802247 RepID=UPI0008D3814F|nr:F0F1 ATP synthase subunit B [Sulfuricurvum sp. RIFCSPLOWO2_12_FULL_43_24]OHD83606.1 MAG: F0F1 ATP synthase subunit B [Sulfuricurvum sp. RIFCSPHIGHO2_12_FULL_44_8]OHD83682.1 MAG: F0F1 ATP synthase subunit B [Sulfuricurvum sp. RIFCSPHIGHO2_02_FULL_43_9]OHD83962.1 MAG: F0F1 ATP synthase subunit B [Sulfuricurvum sp. RIFCSPLOWO2_02_43_6]OHD86922.1 MAG: F0F1 ATP synthase subunit B [Sulfuricurvum sp. RIFCSPLOWO2_02_FULL_43_45]OHD87408.1 MAG: F0F1 ATP synthase subunit B [Sulfuricurvum sp. RIFCSPLOW